MKIISLCALLSVLSLVSPAESVASRSSDWPKGNIHSNYTFAPIDISQSQAFESKPRAALFADQPALNFSHFPRLAKVRFITDQDNRINFDRQDFSIAELCRAAGYGYQNCPAGYVTGGSCPYDSSFVKECFEPDQWCLQNGYSNSSCSAPQYPSESCPHKDSLFRGCETDNKRACEELGYSAVCDSGMIADPASVCRYDSSWHGCICNPCSSYDYTAEEATAQGWHPSPDVCNSCGTARYKRIADACDGYFECDNGPETGAPLCWSGNIKKYAACKSCSCEDEGYFRNQTQCGLGYVLSENETCPCDASYKKCVTSCRIQALNSGNYAEDANGILYSKSSPSSAFIEYDTDEIPTFNTDGNYYQNIYGAVAIDLPACRALAKPVLTASAQKDPYSLSHHFVDIDLTIVGDGKYIINRSASLGEVRNTVNILKPFDLEVNNWLSFSGSKKLNVVTITYLASSINGDSTIKELNVLAGALYRQWERGHVNIDTLNLSGEIEVARDGSRNQYWTVKNLNISDKGKMVMTEYTPHLDAQKVTIRDQGYMAVSKNTVIAEADLHGHGTMFFDLGNDEKSSLGKLNMYPDESGKPCLLWREGTLSYNGTDYASQTCGSKNYYGYWYSYYVADKNQTPAVFDNTQTCPLTETYNTLSGYKKFENYCLVNRGN